VLLILGAAGHAVGLFPSEARRRAASQQTPSGQAGPPPAQALTDQFTAWWQAQPRITLPVSSAGAAVVIVKFTDIQCGLCATTHFALKPVLAKYESQYPGAVRYIVKDYPLQPECNSSITRPFHLAACDAAVAVRLARENGRAESLEDWFYGNQATLTPVTVRRAAASIGGVKDFEARYSRAIGDVKADVSLGRLLNVHGTPTFYVNGVRAEDGNQPITVQYLDLAIGLELKKAGVAK
jgi:protein-disulfide isomerase